MINLAIRGVLVGLALLLSFFGTRTLWPSTPGDQSAAPVDPGPAAPVTRPPIQTPAEPVLAPARTDLNPVQRQEVYDALWQTLEKEYPYFAELGLDWQAVKAKYDLAFTKLRPEHDAAFDLFVRRLLAEIDDSHVWLDYPMDEAARPPLRTEPAGDQILISEVAPGSAAEAAGFQVGMALVSVDGRPVATAWQELADLISASLPHRARWGAARAILNGIPQTQVTVSAQNPGQPPVTATFVRDQSPAPGRAPFEQRTLDGGVAYMRISSFERPVVRDQYLAAMTTIGANEPPGLVIDLRGNSGGNQFWAVDLINTMIPAPTMAGYVQDLTDHSFREMPAAPVSDPYTGPVYLLVDPGCMSACDFFAAFIERSGRGKLIGETPSGATHEGAFVEMPHGFALHYGGVHQLFGPDKQPIERNPAKVAYPVTLTAADLIAGRDPALAKALELLAP